MLKKPTETFYGKNTRSIFRRLALAAVERSHRNPEDQGEFTQSTRSPLRQHGSEMRASLNMKNFDGGSSFHAKVFHLEYLISEEEVDDGHYSVDDYETQGRVQIKLMNGEQPKVLFARTSAAPNYPAVRRFPLDIDLCSVTPEPASTGSYRSSFSSVSTLTSLDLSDDDEFDTDDDEYLTAVDLDKEVTTVKEKVVVTNQHIEHLKEEFKSLSNEFKTWESRHALHNLSIKKLSKGLEELSISRQSSPVPMHSPVPDHGDCGDLHQSPEGANCNATERSADNDTETQSVSCN